MLVFYLIVHECGTEKHCSAFTQFNLFSNGYIKVVAVLLLGQYIPSTGYEPKKRDRKALILPIDKFCSPKATVVIFRKEVVIGKIFPLFDLNSTLSVLPKGVSRS